MGMSVGSWGGGGRRGRRGRRHSQPISEINVTPFVDVMLVLLIIFMVAAPLLTSGVPVDLPKTAAKALNVDTKPITISVNGQGQLFLQEDEISEADLIVKLTALADAGSGFDERILVRGDRASNYGAVLKVMGTISSAGYKKIGLVSINESAG
ncbi:MAG: protein TolR [Hyphomicrobiales bacterium]